MDRQPTRRRVLKTTGAGAAGLTGALAGCMNRITDTTSTNGTQPSPAVNNTPSDGNRTDNTTDGDDHETLDPPDNGAVVFVYDDGPIEDYTKAFPVHQQFDAPATAGIVSTWIGRDDYQSNGCMGVGHLKALVDGGWEIASHTTEHTSLAAFELINDAAPGDTRIYPAEK